MKAQEILDIQLNTCYVVHKKEIPIEYHSYLLKAMENYGRHCFEVSRMGYSFGPYGRECEARFDTFEEYLKNLG